MLGCLELTEGEAATLHDHLSAAAEKAAAQTALRAKYSIASRESFLSIQGQRVSLGEQLAKQRTAGLKAASEAQAAREAFASHVRSLGADLASKGKEELARSAAALEAACSEAAGVLSACSKALGEQSEAMVTAAIAAQTEVEW